MIGFFLGRTLPREKLSADSPRFRCHAFEDGGMYWKKFGVHKWQKRMPDMSRLFRRLMPPKNMQGAYRERLEAMIGETMVAELIHTLLIPFGIPCLFIWRGIGGVICFLLFSCGNIPFIIIQRYNRPRLLRLLEQCRTAEAAAPAPQALGKSI